MVFLASCQYTLSMRTYGTLSLVYQCPFDSCLNWSKTQRNTFFFHVICQTRRRVSSEYPNTEKWVEKRGAAEYFITHFEVCGYLMKHSFECLITLFKLILKCFENEGIKSTKSMEIITRYLNLDNGTVAIFFVFSS